MWCYLCQKKIRYITLYVSFFRLYHNIRNSDYGDVHIDDETTLKKVEAILEQLSFQKNNIKTVIFEDRPVIAICTDFMQKVHKMWPYSSELAFLDSTGNLIEFNIAYSHC